MELLNSIPAAVGLGVLIGFVIGWLSRSGAAGKSKEMTRSLKQSKDEMDEYRKEVTEHFEKTAMLVGAMTEQYRAVYDHLADGAQNLCNDPTARLDAIGQGEALIASQAVPDAANPEPPEDDDVTAETQAEPVAASSAEDAADAESKGAEPPVADNAQAGTETRSTTT